ncbi:MAG: GTP-binding protein [Candidatus Thorarchaeota archaeon]
MVQPRVLLEIEDDTNTSAIAVGDVTSSGRPELLTGGRDGVLKLYDANQSEIHLLAQADLGGSILAVRIADANNDGQMEIIVARSLSPSESPGSGETLQIYRYSPSGTFELLGAHPIDRFVTTLTITDVTGDNKNEILAGGSDSTLRILRMDSENNLTEFINHQLRDMPLTIGTCDVVGDEHEEIVIGNRDKTLHVLKIVDSSIEEIDVIELPSPVISIAAGDLLGDRKMELGVVTHDGSIRVYRNEENKLELFSKLENANALSIRIAELNADHMDEIVIATSDYKIDYYNLYMAELKKIATVDIGSKILSLAIGDAGGDDRLEVLVGISNGPLKIVEGLYHLIPRFQVKPKSESGTGLIGTLTVLNVTDQPVTGVTGKLYWFPKEMMDVSPQQIRLDIGPYESKTIEIDILPREEGTIVIRPIVLMWTDESGGVRQVTTPETAVLAEAGTVTAAPAEAPAVTLEGIEEASSTEETSPLFSSVSGTGFKPLTEADRQEIEAQTSGTAEDAVRQAEQLLDQLFGDASSDAQAALDDVKRMIEGEPAPAEAETATETVVTEAPPPVSNESALVAEIRNRQPKPPPPKAAPDAYSFLFKVMIIGEGAVGKTTLVNRYVTGSFERDYKTTIGSQFAVKLTHIFPPESEYAVGIKIQAWDVAGQARFAAVRKMYYSGAAGVILVFDVTRRRSFTELEKWVQEADESIGSRVPMVVVGNKIDLPDRMVSAEEAKKWAEDQGFLYMESSAKTGEGVADMFTVLAELMWRETSNGK